MLLRLLDTTSKNLKVRVIIMDSVLRRPNQGGVKLGIEDGTPKPKGNEGLGLASACMTTKALQKLSPILSDLKTKIDFRVYQKDGMACIVANNEVELMLILKAIEKGIEGNGGFCIGPVLGEEDDAL